MPYITQTARQMIADGGPVQTSGELNYVITKHLTDKFWPGEALVAAVKFEIAVYLKQHGASYSVFNDIIGALECARREWKRRRGVGPGYPNFLSEIADEFYDAKIAPYEDQKIQQNGDIY